MIKLDGKYIDVQVSIIMNESGDLDIDEPLSCIRIQRQLQRRLEPSWANTECPWVLKDACPFVDECLYFNNNACKEALGG